VSFGNRTLFRLRPVAVLLAFPAAIAFGQEAQLPEITITSGAESGYVVKRASTGTKTDAPIHETPVAIQVVPREVMDDQQVINVKEATKNISSVLPSTYQF
jgi:iron complex outermembrane receptor protein